jgi:hemoglobin/transferrin/lactoferrin receptor protein
VNALTKSRQDYGPGTDWNGGLFYRFASAEESHIGRPEVSAQWEEKVGLHLGGSIKEFGDFHGGRDVGEQPNTGYSEWDIDGKLEYLVAPHSKFVFAHQTVNLDDAWRTHSTIYGVDWEGTRHGSDQVRKFDQSRTLDYLQFHAQELEGFAEEVHASVSHHYQGEMETRVRSSGVRERQGVDVNTLGLSLQLHSPSPVGRWIYGAEYYRDWVNSGFRRFDAEGNLEQERVQGPVADDATYDLAGVYLENHLPLFGDRLELILGGRYTYAGVDAQRIRDPLTGGTFSLTDSWDNAVGNGRLLYQVQPEHLSVFMGASQGFRAPNLSDLTRWDADWGQEIPTPGVDPELFLSLEIGARAQYGPLTAEAAYFYTFIDDLIVRVPTGELSPNGDIIVSKANSGRGFVQGVELAASVRVLRDWMLWGNGTWIDGEVDAPRTPGGPDVTEPISRLMPETLNAGLRWNHPKGRLWAEFATTVAGRADQLASNDLLDTQRIPPGGTPGYAVYHLRAGWSPWRQTSLTAALENITDEDYRIHGSGVNEPGRNFVIAAQVRF